MSNKGKVRINYFRLIGVILVFIILIYLIVNFFVNRNVEKTSNAETNSSSLTNEGAIIEENKLVDDNRFNSFSNKIDTFKENIKNLNIFSDLKLLSADKLKEDFNLESIGDYVGLLLRDDNKDNFQEVAIIFPKNQAQNDTMILNMIKRYAAIKEKYPDEEYLKKNENISINQVSGVSIFIVSKNNDALKQAINEAYFN